MKKFKIVFALLMVFSVMGCKKPLEHQFIYTFNNTEAAETENANKVINVLERRMSFFKLKHKIEALSNNDIALTVYSNTLKKEAFNNLITNRGKLEFWETYEAEQFISYILDIEEALKGEAGEAYKEVDLFLNAVVSSGYPGSPILFYVKPTDTLDFISTLNTYKSKLPQDQKFVKFLYGRPSKNGSLPVYTIKSNRGEKPVMSGEVITAASQDYDFRNRPTVSIKMNKDGALQWERLTEKAYNDRSNIAIVINNVVFSAPGVTAGAIKGGRSEIAGDFTKEEAQVLAAILASRGEIPQLKLLEYKKNLITKSITVFNLSL
ncbi:SecDF P1 head subdomain-containing protein [Lacinutrix chionoecetis]